jgi:DNA gyrase subunit A
MSDEPVNDGILDVTIEHELEQSYIDYAMSVIVGRALPDVRDGLKPVHRRVLYAMSELGNEWNKPYKKSARIVGDVIGKYHPHGDTAVYDAIVRMAQPFSMRYPLVDGQGNFGSVDGDSAAAMRYTEVRMTKLVQNMLLDLDKDTVDFVPNYDNSEFAPNVLPARFPNLLVNGSSGIAVGMATNIPPHHIGEVLNACLAMVNNPDIDLPGLMEHINGPDFPTGGIILGQKGIEEAYRTGRGKVYVRACCAIEETKTGKSTIVVTELPYQVNKARLIEKIAILVRDKKCEGISDIQDHSDKDGMRIVIDIKRGENAEVVLNKLYAQTSLQTVFGINMVCLINNKPACLSLIQILKAFIHHRREVITRRTQFELSKAKKRGHVLEGLAITMANIDEVIALIKRSKNQAEAREALLAKAWVSKDVEALLKKVGADLCRPHGLSETLGLVEGGYRLSPVQAQAILDLKLHRLTGLEREQLTDEYNRVIEEIKRLMQILKEDSVLMEVIKDEFKQLLGDWSKDKRRTLITNETAIFSEEQLIADEMVVVTVSAQGYSKIQTIDTYRSQHRGGKGKQAVTTQDDDFIKYLLVSKTHDYLLFFTSKGKVYWLKAYQLPMVGRNAKGKPIVNFLTLEPNETVTAIMSVREFSEDRYVFMVTAQGKVKKVRLTDFSRPRQSGVIALDLMDGDSLIGVDITTGDEEIMLFGSHGKAIRFHESEVRSMGRTARGVRGMALPSGESVISMLIARDEGDVLTATALGYGKRSEVSAFRKTARASQGVKAMRTTDKTGSMIAAVYVKSNQDILLMTNKGVMVRTPAEKISKLGRSTQGVRLIKVSKEERLITLQKVHETDDVDVPETEDSDGVGS